MDRPSYAPALVLIGVLCLSLVCAPFGCGVLGFGRGQIESQLTFREGFSFPFPANIGLLERSAQSTDTMIISVPEHIDMNDNPETVFWESPLQETQRLVLEGWKKMKRGATEGAEAGFEVGSFFCLPAMGVQGCSDFTCLAAILLLCGGGVVGGTTVGLVMGVVVGPFVYPWANDTPQEQIELELTFVKQNLVEGIWEELTEMGLARWEQPTGVNGSSSEKAPTQEFEFGSPTHPIDALIEIQPIQLQLVRSPQSESSQLTFRIVMKVKIFDLYHQVMAKQNIQIDRGPFTYKEWAEDFGQRLRAAIDDMYKQVADRIVDDLRETSLPL